MIAKRKLSVADFLLMGESGVFALDERVELLNGEIYTMSPPSSKHAAWVDRVMKALAHLRGPRYRTGAESGGSLGGLCTRVGYSRAGT